MKSFKAFHRLFLLSVLSLITFRINAQQATGYAIMRVFDCNKGVSMGSGFIAAKILIAYETGKTEEVELLPYNEKNEIENIKKITDTLNKMKTKGYFLISQTTTGEQGNMISDYTFLRQQ
jgi:hypothetical protein